MTKRIVSRVACIMLFVAVAAMAATPPAATAPADGPALRQSDVIVFVGDELTEIADGRRTNRPTFPELVESFLSVRASALRMRFINAGWTGDTVSRVLLRLERDVLIHKPTVVVICLGLNDPNYLEFSQDRLTTFREGLTELVWRCHASGARVWLISPPSVEENRNKKVRVFRDRRQVVVDLGVIHYNDTLRQYAAAIGEVARSAGLGFVDWFSESMRARQQAQARRDLDTFTLDGRLPNLRGVSLIASALLEAWGAEPVRVSIDLNWHDAKATVSIGNDESVSIPVGTTETGDRLLTIEHLPLPWPLPGGRSGSLQSNWRASRLCQFTFRMPDPPDNGIMLIQDAGEQGIRERAPISASELRSGFNLATAEPLRSLQGTRELYKLIATKNQTRHTVWRRLQLSAPQEPELADAHRLLIEAWTAYIEGYEKMIGSFPMFFDASFILAEATEPERLPTSRPAPPLIPEVPE